MPQIYDMGSTALLPLRRKACWGFFRPKNPTASAGFEPANLGTKGQHATPRPPKPVTIIWKMSLCAWRVNSSGMWCSCHMCNFLCCEHPRVLCSFWTLKMKALGSFKASTATPPPPTNTITFHKTCTFMNTAVRASNLLFSCMAACNECRMILCVQQQQIYSENGGMDSQFPLAFLS